MNNEEAKFLLSAYRPEGDDAADPRFAEALAQAERDPDLAEWLRNERRFDSAIAEALAAVPVPADLRGKILAGSAVSQPRTWPTRRRVLALAAGLVLLGVLASVWFPRASGLETWQRDALVMIPKFGSGAERFDLVDRDPAVLRRWLETQNAPAPAALPVALQGTPALGCKTITSAGRPVSIICFKTGTGEFVHLVVTEQETLSRPPPAAPRFVRDGTWMTASWSADGRAYMLATTGAEKNLREMLREAALAAMRVTRALAAVW